MPHRVRRHEWVDGALRTFDHFFKELESALDFAGQQTTGHSKVYTEAGELVHTAKPVVTETYA